MTQPFISKDISYIEEKIKTVRYVRKENCPHCGTINISKTSFLSSIFCNRCGYFYLVK